MGPKLGSAILTLTVAALAFGSCGKRAPPPSALRGPHSTVEVGAPAITQLMTEKYPELRGTARCSVPVDFPEGWPVPQLFTVDDCWREDPQIDLDVLREIQQLTAELRFEDQRGGVAACRTIVVMTYELAGADTRIYAEASDFCLPRRL